MARGYWVIQNDITNLAVYAVYRTAIEEFVEAKRGKFIVRAGRKKDVEGAPRSRHIVIEFHDYEQAVAAYESPEYRKIVALRAAALKGDMAIVEGV
jgi:uncharacterized protein (DUF1330 family)